MGNLGKLWFELGVKDMTASDMESIRKDVLKRLGSLNVDIGIDAEALGKSLDEALALTRKKIGNVSVTAGVDKETLAKEIGAALEGTRFTLKAGFDTDALQKEIASGIRDALKGTKFTVQPKLDKEALGGEVAETLRKAVSKALGKEPFKVGITVDKAEATKAVTAALEKAGLSLNTKTTASDVRAQRVLEIQQRMNEAAEKHRAILERTRAQVDKMRQSMERNKKATETVSDVLANQSAMASQLGSQIANAFSLYAIERFLQKVIEIGGEFQQQRIALQTIFGDADKANELFGQIKALAVESPFEFKDLSNYTKQLAAFNIPYDEMYETTRRLADISAGVGVDMGRLILAYGQVRSAEVLKGTELRQFTEAGIPLVQALADKFTELEGRVVSAGDVFDKISAKAVPFEMVKEVLWDLTDEGGRFFNMQSALADTLGGKLSNLRDAFDIMLSDIAESNDSVLSKGLDALTGLMAKWETYAGYIEPAVVALLSYKAAVVLVTAATSAWVTVSKGLKAVKALISAVTTATWSATAATSALQVAMSGIGLALSAAALLWDLFRDKTESATKSINDVGEAVGAARKEIERTRGVDTMIDRLEELRNTTHRTADEEREMAKLNKTLYAQFGQLATQADEFGKRMRLSTDIMREANAQAREAAITSVEGELRDAKEALEKIDGQRQEILDDLAGLSAAASNQRFKEKWSKEFMSLTLDAETLRERIGPLEEELESLRRAAQGLGDVEDSVTGLDEGARDGWRERIKAALGEGLEMLIPKDDEDYSTWLSRFNSELENTKKALDEMDASPGLFSEEDAETIEDMRKAYEGMLAIRERFNLDTGKKSSGSTGKDWAKEIKSAADALAKARADIDGRLADRQGSNALGAMTEGREKELYQLRLAYERQVREIGEQEATLREKIAKYDEALAGGGQSDSGSEAAMAEDARRFKDLRLEAYREYMNGVAALDTKILDEYAGYLDKRRALEDKYAADRSALVAAGGDESNIAELDRARTEALQRLDIEYASRESGFKAWVDSLSDYGVVKLREMLYDAITRLRLLTVTDPDDAEALARVRAQIAEISALIDETDGTVESGVKPNLREVSRQINEIGRDFKDAGSDIGGVIGDIVEKIGNLVTGLLEVKAGMEAFAKAESALEKASASMSVVSAAVSVVSTVVSGISSLFGGTDHIGEFNDAAAELNQTLATLKENARIDSDDNTTIFGDDVWANAIANIEAAKDALDRYAEAVAGITGSKSAASLTVGAAVDTKALAEAIGEMELQMRHSTWFRSAKYTTIADALPELFNDDGTIDMDALEEFVDSDMFDKLSEENQEALQQMLDDWQTYEDALDAVKDYLSDIFGDLGDSLMDSLVEAFESGEDAASAFTDSVSEMIESLATNLIYASTIGPLLEEAEEKMLEITSNSDLSDSEKYESYVQTLSALIDEALGQQELASDLMQAYKDLAADYGLDIYSSDDSDSSTTSAIESVTEETASILASYMNAIRQDVSVKRTLLEDIAGNMLPTISVVAQSQLDALNEINANTAASAAAAETIKEALSSVITVGSGGKAVRIK